MSNTVLGAEQETSSLISWRQIAKPTKDIRVINAKQRITAGSMKTNDTGTASGWGARRAFLERAERQASWPYQHHAPQAEERTTKESPVNTAV